MFLFIFLLWKFPLSALLFLVKTPQLCCGHIMFSSRCVKLGSPSGVCNKLILSTTSCFCITNKTEEWKTERLLPHISPLQRWWLSDTPSQGRALSRDRVLWAPGFVLSYTWERVTVQHADTSYKNTGSHMNDLKDTHSRSVTLSVFMKSCLARSRMSGSNLKRYGI